MILLNGKLYARTLLLAFLVFILLLVAGVTFLGAFKGDVVTYIITGERVLDRRWDLLYKPVPRGAPFSYMPQTSAFFTLFSLFGREIGSTLLVALNGFLLWAGFLILLRLQKIPIEFWKGHLYGILSIVCFFFTIILTLYIGQIDLLILFLLLFSIYLYLLKYQIGAGILLALAVQLKPQFAILLIPFILNLKFRVLFSFGCTILLSAGAFLIYYDHSLNTFYNLFTQYYDMARTLSENTSVVNQSYSNVIRMLFSRHAYIGAFYPAPWTPATLSEKLIVLPDLVVKSIQYLGIVSAVIATSYILIRLHIQKGKTDTLYTTILLLALVPTISPAFWQVHLIYMIPVTFWLTQDMFISDRPAAKSLKFFFFLSCLGIACANPLFLGYRKADLVQAKGIYYFCTVILFVLTLIRAPWIQGEQIRR